MTVKELIKELLNYNLNANINVIAHCKEENFTLTFGGNEGETKENTDRVSIYVDRLCTNENTN